MRCGSIGRCNRDADAHSLARIVVKTRHEDFATIAVFDVIADHLSLFALHFDDTAIRAATLVATTCGTVVLVDIAANRATNDRTGDSRGVTAIAFADLVAERTTNDRAKYGAAGWISTGAFAILALTFVAFLTRFAGHHRLVDRIDTQHIGITVADAFGDWTGLAVDLVGLGECYRRSGQQDHWKQHSVHEVRLA